MPAGAFLATFGGFAFHMAQFHTAIIFPRNRGLVTSLLVGAWIASSIVYEIVRIVFAKSGREVHAYRGMLLGLASLTLAFAPLMAWMMPRKAFQPGDRYVFIVKQLTWSSENEVAWAASRLRRSASGRIPWASRHNTHEFVATMHPSQDVQLSAAGELTRVSASSGATRGSSHRSGATALGGLSPSPSRRTSSMQSLGKLLSLPVASVSEATESQQPETPRLASRAEDAPQIDGGGARGTGSSGAVGDGDAVGRNSGGSAGSADVDRVGSFADALPSTHSIQSQPEAAQNVRVDSTRSGATSVTLFVSPEDSRISKHEVMSSLPEVASSRQQSVDHVKDMPGEALYREAHKLGVVHPEDQHAEAQAAQQKRQATQQKNACGAMFKKRCKEGRPMHDRCAAHWARLQVCCCCSLPVHGRALQVACENFVCCDGAVHLMLSRTLLNSQSELDGAYE